MTYRISQLTTTQRVLLIIQAALVLLGVTFYAALGRQQVIRFGDGRLKVSEENGAAVYAGKDVKLVAEGDTLDFYQDGEFVAAYTVTEDPNAVPTEGTAEQVITKPEGTKGVEIRRNGSLLFRGGYRIISDTVMCFDAETGELDSSFFSASVTTTQADTYIKPGTVLRLLYHPEVEKRGEIGCVLLGIFFCIVNAVSILFADELFRWNLRFSIRNVENVEPSEWELFSRGLSWVVLTGTALACLLLGALGA